MQYATQTTSAVCLNIWKVNKLLTKQANFCKELKILQVRELCGCLQLCTKCKGSLWSSVAKASPRQQSPSSSHPAAVLLCWAKHRCLSFHYKVKPGLHCIQNSAVADTTVHQKALSSVVCRDRITRHARWRPSRQCQTILLKSTSRRTAQDYTKLTGQLECLHWI